MEEALPVMGIDGLDTYHPGQSPSVLTPSLHARILAATRKKPADGSTHRSCRKLAAYLGVSKDVVHRVWKEEGSDPETASDRASTHSETPLICVDQ
jgi:hypothetical protein